MALELTRARQITPKSTLSYDTESVRLIATFGDEVTAYRARRHWMTVFAEHFMLELKKDYELKIKSVSSEGLTTWQVTCSFHSACGRYAFWRLINKQAPEAETRIGEKSSKRKEQNKRIFSAAMKEGSKGEEWIIRSNEKKSFSDILNQAIRKIGCLMF